MPRRILVLIFFLLSTRLILHDYPFPRSRAHKKPLARPVLGSLPRRHASVGGLSDLDGVGSGICFLDRPGVEGSGRAGHMIAEGGVLLFGSSFPGFGDSQLYNTYPSWYAEMSVSWCNSKSGGAESPCGGLWGCDAGLS